MAEATPLERWAERGGSRVVGGLEVLVRQGALSLTLWTGREAPLDAMRAAAQGERINRLIPVIWSRSRSCFNRYAD